MHPGAINIIWALRLQSKYVTLGAQDQTKYFCTIFGPDLKLCALQISQVSKQMQFVRWSRSQLTLTAKPLNSGRHSQARWPVRPVRPSGAEEVIIFSQIGS